ncbi:hypothetical protein Tco_1502504 [Tanacetum coccineum]
MSSSRHLAVTTLRLHDSVPDRASTEQGGIHGSLEQDEHEPMFVQAHDPDYVPEPIYPEYIPLEDEHEFPAEEQPLPPVDSPTAESPGYVTESDLEEDPEEYEDDETEDGPVDYSMDGGDDGAVDEPVFPPKGTEPIIPPHSTDITIGARIIVQPQISISLLPEAEVERLLAMTTPSPSPPISLLLTLCRRGLVSSLPATLPLPPYLYIPPPVDHRDDVPEFELSPRKRLCLSTLGPRDVGYGIRDTWVDPAEAVLEMAPVTLREVNIGSQELDELHSRIHRTCIALLEDAQDIRFVYTNEDMVALETHRDHVYAHETHLQAHQTQLQLQGTLIQTQHQVHETRFQMQQAELAALRETDHRRQAQMVETLRVIRDMRREMSDMQAELLLNCREQQRRARQPGPEARIPDHQDASGDADSHI